MILIGKKKQVIDMDERVYYFTVETMRTGYVIHRTEDGKIVETVHSMTKYDVARNVMEMLKDAETF